MSLVEKHMAAGVIDVARRMFDAVGCNSDLDLVVCVCVCERDFVNQIKIKSIEPR